MKLRCWACCRRGLGHAIASEAELAAPIEPMRGLMQDSMPQPHCMPQRESMVLERIEGGLELVLGMEVGNGLSSNLDAAATVPEQSFEAAQISQCWTKQHEARNNT
jgi:hypothetical protein